MQAPETINEVEIYAHNGFLKSMIYCDKIHRL